MRQKRANIDSLNLSSPHLEAIFIHNKDYSVEIIKTKSVFKPKVWRETFGKALTKNIVEAKIIHTYLGLRLPLKAYSRSRDSPVIEFAGLYGYNERSKLLRQTLGEMESRLQDARVMRIDIAIDFNGRISKSIIKALSKLREPFMYGNTTYWKTSKEKKINRRMDIKIYNKAHQAKLGNDLIRLEFCFKPDYLKQTPFKDITSLYPKMEKSIKRATGLNVKIEHISQSEK